MSMKRRHFLRSAAGAAGAAWIGRPTLEAGPSSRDETRLFAHLRPMTTGVAPITDAERTARIEKARRLMVESGFGAVIMEGGSSLRYFTDVSWWNSERVFAWVLPAKGEMAWVCPKFEEDRAGEQLRFGEDLRTWEEDADPYAVLAGVLRDRGLSMAKVGLEEQTRFFLFDGLRKAAPRVEWASADPVTVGCRAIKSAAELALMQRANDITVVAYKAVLSRLREGMTKEEFGAEAQAAFAALGVQGGIGASFGEQTALPHGSRKPRSLGRGDIVLMDGGCDVEGYNSDISRTVVFGTPTKRQREIWELEKKAQLAAFAAAGPGVPHEAVDIAARKVLEAAGLGPGYGLPGLPHRTGHGIGLDGHEWTYLVRGNTAPMRPGMCFTDEPMIVFPGEFGVRLEDDFHITEDAAEFFSHPSPSIEQPFE
jgi:Xaa-Pro dipeptidase